MELELDQPKLIAEIKSRPGLWSAEHPTDRDEKLALWKEVGAALYKDWDKITKAKAYDRVLYLQRKWRSLRDAYRREIRARATGVRINRSVYRYFRIMSFLGGYEGITSSVNATEQEEEEENHDNTEHDSVENHDETEFEALEEEHLELYDDTNPDPLTSSFISSSKPSKAVKKRSSRLKSKKRKVVSSPSIEDIDDNQEIEMPVYSLDMREREREETDSDRLFLMSFLPEMKQLPVNIKMWARVQIANIMQEAITCQYNNSNPEGLGVKKQRHDSVE